MLAEIIRELLCSDSCGGMVDLIRRKEIAGAVKIVDKEPHNESIRWLDYKLALIWRHGRASLIISFMSLRKSNTRMKLNDLKPYVLGRDETLFAEREGYALRSNSKIYTGQSLK